MPRAVDPSLNGGGVPITSSPLNRMSFSIDPQFDLLDFLEGVVNALPDAIETLLFPAIENMTGVDLSAFLPLLHLMEVDFSSPEAFLQSLIDSLVALPGALLVLLNGLIEQITDPDNLVTLTNLLNGLIGLLVSLPSMLVDLAHALIDSGSGLLGIDSPLNSHLLYNLIPQDLIAQLSASNIGTAITNLIADPFFLDAASFTGLGQWFHDAAAGFGGNGAARTTANGTTKELLGNLIPVSSGQVMPITGKAKWSGLVGTGNPIALAVTGYNSAGSAIDQTVVASHNTTPTTTDWVDLTGSYTIPTDVTSMRTRLVVSSTATAGTVWFSHLSATKSQSLLQKLIAGTNPGENLTQDITHLFTGITTNAIELLNKAGLTDFNDLLATIGGSFGNDLAAAEERLSDFLHSLSPLNADNVNTGAISDQFVPGLSTIHDAVVTAVGNLSGSGFDIEKVLEVFRGQTHAVTDNSAVLMGMFPRLAAAESKIAALPVSLGGTGVGISFGGIVGTSDTDEFERTSSTNLGPTWLQFYSGPGAGQWATPNGHDAEYMWSGHADREFLCIRNNSAVPRSLTDYQRVTQVLSSKGTRKKLLVAGDWFGHNDVWLRVSDDTTSLANVTGIRIRWGADGSLNIVRFLAGTPTTLKSFGTGYIDPPGPGAQLIGEAGDMNGGDAGRRYFRGIIGNSLRIEVTETGTASGFGAAFRRWGHGGRVEGWAGPLDNGQERPGNLHHWQGMDQVFA